MKKLAPFFFIFGLLSAYSGSAQNTVGLISYSPMKSSDGYNLMFPHNQPTVYLFNNCGEIVHTWEDDENWRPGNMAYLTEAGLLYKGKRDATVAGNPIWAGGGGAIFEIRDWDNNLVWDFEMNDSINRLHHDFAVMPNGHILALAWELKTANDCLEAGRDTSTLAQAKLWPDWILEIDPFNDTIVWEWHTWDHLIQDFDSTKVNFGVISEHPKLIDLNYGRENGHPDWMHANSLDYNAELDQIMISVPYFDEIWIIDHTTTTAEAASHHGGFSNIGGDLMYRWGNPITYQRGDSSNQKLFFQHDAHWIDDFIEKSNPYYGSIAIFNNRVGLNYSSGAVIRSPWNMYEWNYPISNGTHLPTDFDLVLNHPTKTALWSTGLSSLQFLNNGNALITSGRRGYSFELTPNNEIVWEYITPLLAGKPVEQGDTLSINNNLTFRVKRYPIDFSGFVDKDLSSKGWLELNPDSTYCQRISSTGDFMVQHAFKIFPNPAHKSLTVEWDGLLSPNIEIIDATGQRMAAFKNCRGGRKYIDTSTWRNGIYALTINSKYSRKLLVMH